MERFDPDALAGLDEPMRRYHAERRFGALVIPSRVTVGWWFDQPQWWPFFEAEVLAATPVAPR